MYSAFIDVHSYSLGGLQRFLEFTMPYWSIAEWRARIGSSRCALGRPIKQSVRYGARVVKKELTLNRVVITLILLTLLIGVNIGARSSLEEGHHYQLMSELLIP